MVWAIGLAVVSAYGMGSPSELSRSQDAVMGSRICFSEHPDWEVHSSEMIRHRYGIYKELGCEMVRIHTQWSGFEKEEGAWDDAAFDSLLNEVKRSGFKIKLIAGTLMAPPEWFLEQHPDARMIDQFGQYSRNTISYWYPGLADVLETKLRRILQTLEKKDMLHQVEYILVDLGPAGEGIYPANWTMDSTPGHEIRTGEAFSCYSNLAQQDFRHQMTTKYTSIDQANKAWGTALASWDEVNVPMPGTAKGKLWEDVLNWYRDTKRKAFRIQIENVTNRINEFNLQAKPLLYLPGSSMVKEDIDDAVQTGGGNDSVRLMIDNEYLMQLGNSYGCIMQNTGFENWPEVKRMKQRMKRDGVDYTTVWGENAGTPRGAGDPIYLAKIVIEENLWGMDYTHTRFIFEDDFMTPNSRAVQLKEAVRLIREYYDEGIVPDFGKYYAPNAPIKSYPQGLLNKPGVSDEH